jgi:hypothetical protein
MPQLASSLARDRWGGEEKVEILKQAPPASAMATAGLFFSYSLKLCIPREQKARGGHRGAKASDKRSIMWS